MDILRMLWGFCFKSLILAIIIGIFIGQYFALKGHTGAGEVASDFVDKIERFMKS